MTRGRAGIFGLAVVALLALAAGEVRAQGDVRVPAEWRRSSASIRPNTIGRPRGCSAAGARTRRYSCSTSGSCAIAPTCPARRDLKPDGDPALFASLSEVVGRPLNEYAFGDIPALARTIEAVLAYGAADPDRFTPPASSAGLCRHPRRAGTMPGEMLRDAEKIRASRAEKGLETASRRELSSCTPRQLSSRACGSALRCGSRSAVGAWSQVDEPIHAANQHAAANDVSERHRDQAC